MNRYKLSVAGVDVNQGLKRLNNDKEFYEELLQKFCEDVHYQQLLKALEQGDAKEAFQHGHALKGMAGNLSMVRLYDALVPLVEELRNGNPEKAKKLLQEVKDAYEVLMGALQS